MLNFKCNDGYSLVEMLIALTLLALFLFLVNDILPFLSSNSNNYLKLKAINAAKNQMENTLIFLDFNDFTKELDRQLLLKQTIEEENNLTLISITVSHKRSNRVLYKLNSYFEKKDQNRNQ